MATSDEPIGAADVALPAAEVTLPAADVPANEVPPVPAAPPAVTPVAAPAAAPGAAPAGARAGGRPARRIDEEPAFLLHAVPYRETSLVLDLFTRDYGRIAAVARGAKRPRSKLRAVLLAFQPLQVSWSGASELRTLVAAEWVGGLPAPQGDALVCGFYLNELLRRLLAREDAHPTLFDGYVEALGRLGHGEPIEPALRRFEWLLLRETGFGVDLRRDAAGHPIEAARRYAFEPGAGFVPAREARAGDYRGATLLALADGRFDADTQVEAKQLSRTILNQQLDGQSLATRQILIDLQRL